jgi:arylsulfatase A-like enzyme
LKYALPWLVTLAACAPPGEEAPPSLVLYVVDTLRADRLGAYGYGGETSPNFDAAVGAQGVLFERCWSTGPWTLPAMASLWSGVHPWTHQVLDRTRTLDLAQRPWPALLAEAGFQNAAFVSNPIAGSLTGVPELFEVYRERGYTGDGTVPEAGRDARTANAAAARAWIAERTDERPLFLWVHTVEPHIPYTPEPLHVRGDVTAEQALALNTRLLYFQRRSRRPQADGAEQGVDPELDDLRLELLAERARIDALYDSEVRRADEEFGATAEALRAAGVWDEAWVAFTSDHGEELFDHGYLLHGQSVYDELLSVPLWVKAPGTAPAARARIGASTVDLAPTFAELFGLPSDERWEGHSLVPWLNDPTRPAIPERVALANRVDRELQDPFALGRNGARELAWRAGPWKLLWRGPDRPAALFNWVADPGEQRDLAQVHGERVSGLRAAVDAWLAERSEDAGWSRSADALGAAQQGALEELGYAEPREPGER